jgi:hypothetical protein
MQGHLPGPPPPHEPFGGVPLTGYLAMRQQQPLEDRVPEVPDWLDADVYDQPWGPGHSRFVKVTAIVVAVAMVVAGMSTVLEMIFTSH